MNRSVTAITLIAAFITGISSEKGNSKTKDSVTVNAENANGESDDNEDADNNKAR